MIALAGITRCWERLGPLRRAQPTRALTAPRGAPPCFAQAGERGLTPSDCPEAPLAVATTATSAAAAAAGAALPRGSTAAAMREFFGCYLLESKVSRDY